MQKIIPTYHPITILVLLHQECEIHRSIAPLDGLSELVGSVTPRGRYIYHFHSHIALLGQLYSTIRPLCLALFEVLCHSLPGTQEREVVVYYKSSGCTAVLGFSASTQARSEL